MAKRENSIPVREDSRYRMRDPYNSPATWATKIRRALVALVCVVALIGVGFWAWDEVREPSIESYANQEITIKGLGDDFSVTVADLASLDCERLRVTGTGSGQNGESKAGTVNAYGPTLETFLAQYGYSPTDFGRIIFTCKEELDSDGNPYSYKVTLLDEQLTNKVIFSIAQGKAALEEYSQPMRLVMPSESTGQWAYGVIEIDFQKAAGDSSEDVSAVSVGD